MKLSWQGKHARAVYQSLITGGIFILATGLAVNTITPHLEVPQWSYFLIATCWLAAPLGALMYPPAERWLYPAMHVLYWFTYGYVGWICIINHFDPHLALIWLLALVAIGIQYSARGYWWVASLVVVTTIVLGYGWPERHIWQLHVGVLICVMVITHVFLLTYTALFLSTMQQLTHANAVVRKLLEGSDTAQFILGEDATSCLYQNEAMRDLKRTYVPGEVSFPEKIRKLTGRLPDDLLRLALAFPMGQSHTFVHALSTPAGMESQLHIRLTRLKSGAEEWVLVKFTDISAQIQLENRLKAKTEDLEQLVYRASHDLKGPIASILGLTAVAKDTQGQSSASLQYLSLIERVAHRLDNTISSLAEASRLQSGEPARQPIHLEPLIYSLTDQLQTRPEGQGVYFSIRVQEPELFVSDRLVVESMMRHLLHNAVAYRRPQVVHEVHIEITQPPGALEIRVRDNGTGIPAHMRERIFDIFYKGNSHSTGAGLGLYIVKNAVDKLSGVCEIESEEGKGATFIVRLPRKSHEKQVI